MSRSNPELTQNPSTRWFSWNGQNGTIEYYDKSIENKDERTVEVSLPFTFLFLDQLSKVSGWNDSAEKSIYSNEVKNLNRESLTVRTSGSNIIATGLYSEIRDKVKANGGHYLASIYIAYKEGDELLIGNLSLKGAALSSWMEFMKKNQKEVHEKAVKITGFTEGQKGSITYRMPEFSISETTPETDEKARELDKALQEFIKAKPDYTDSPEYSGRSENEPPPPDDSDFPADDPDNLPF